MWEQMSKTNIVSIENVTQESTVLMHYVFHEDNLLDLTEIEGKKGIELNFYDCAHVGRYANSIFFA